ncbi:hypothetical protein QBC47DRAFT_40080, partial [Echria macrotheca]
LFQVSNICLPRGQQAPSVYEWPCLPVYVDSVHSPHSGTSLQTWIPKHSTFRLPTHLLCCSNQLPTMSGDFENHGFQPEPTDQGFQPPQNQGFQPPQNQGFQPPSRPAGGFTQGGFQEMLNLDEMMAFARGSAAGVPVGYDHGLAHGAAKAASSSQTPEPLVSLGFVDTKETKAYGQGYQYGWAQGFSLGYFHGLTKPANGGFSQGGVPRDDD